MLATDAHKGASSNGNSGGDPALVMDVHRDNNRYGNGQGGPTPALGKETSYGMDMVAGAAAAS
jgi:hypothetical protein